MEQELIDKLNEGFTRYIEKYYQMFGGFSCSFSEYKDGIIYIEVLIGNRCTLTDEFTVG